MSDAALASWNDCLTKEGILDFIRGAITKGPAFVPVADRIATFDHDGPLWVEQPLPPQFDFVLEHWAGEIKADTDAAIPRV